MKRIALAFLIVGLLASAGRAETYTIDPMHSSVSFTVRHVIGNVTGRFGRFNGTFNYDPANLKTFSSNVTIGANSVNTGLKKRDDDLKSPRFFDGKKTPTITFKTTSVSDVSGAKAKLHGDLTIHGVTKPVVLDLEMYGSVKDPAKGVKRAGGTAKGTVNRDDFNVGVASGTIGKEVAITIEVEGTSKAKP